MKIDLQNSPWALVLVVALAALLGLMIVSLAFQSTSTTALAWGGMLVTLILTALGFGMSRGKHSDGDSGE